MTTAAARGVLNAAARDIARVAARLFAAHGYEATSVRMIVEAAGVTKPTLYYYFGSKEGLAEALLTMPMALLGEQMRAVLDERGDPALALARIVDAHFAFCREDPDRARFFFALNFGPEGSELMGQIKKSLRALPEMLLEAIGRLADANLIAPERVSACATACRGMIVIAMLDHLYRGRHGECAPAAPSPSDSDEELGPAQAERLVGDLLHGFALPGMGRGSRS
jgi:AcrR family transcriptional regulator